MVVAPGKCKMGPWSSIGSVLPRLLCAAWWLTVARRALQSPTVWIAEGLLMYLQPAAVAQLLETTAGLHSCHTGSGTCCCDGASGQAGLLVVNTLAVLPVALGPFDVQTLRSCWVCTRSSPPGSTLLTQAFVLQLKHIKPCVCRQQPPREHAADAGIRSPTQASKTLRAQAAAPQGARC